MEFSKIISRLAEAFRAMPLREKLVTGGIIAALLLLLLLVSLFSVTFSRDSYQVLFDSLSPRDADRVVEQLKKNGVPFRIVNEQTIEVPYEQLYERDIAIASLFNVEEDETRGVSVGDSGFGGLSAAELRYKQHEEEKREKKIVNVLAPILGGQEYLVANVTIEYDFSQTHSTSETYTPRGTVQSELPDDGAGALDETDAAARRVQENRMADYEVSKTMTTTREDHARIKRISSVVVIDANAPMDEEWERKFAELTTLVKRSIGIDEKRGDQVLVRYFHFLESQAEHFPDSMHPQLERSEIVALVEPYTPFFKLLLVALIAWVLLQTLFRLLKAGGKTQTGSGKKSRPSEPFSAAEQTDMQNNAADAEALFAKVRSAAANSPKEVAVLLQALMDEEKRSGVEQWIRTRRRGV
jgi:flagellar M-ring protein FliF